MRRPLHVGPLACLLLGALGLVVAGCPASGDGEACVGAVSIDENGAPTGYVRCADGAVDARTAGACPTVPVDPCKGTEDDLTVCRTDADCGSTQACMTYSMGPRGAETTGCTCGNVGCRIDADCGAGEACVCGSIASPGQQGFRSICAKALCRTGADCASGECGVSMFSDGCSSRPTLACRAPEDACRASEACPQDMGTWGPPNCSEQPGTTGFACHQLECIVGRPLLVDGAPRAAAAVPRGDWGAHIQGLDLGAVPSAARAAIARHWARSAAFEHASVASFARFSMQLLALGAPPDLVRDAHAAALDEIEHARIAFGLASSYGGAPLGPGPLDLQGVTLDADPSTVVRALVEEACVGETVAAALALAAADAAEAPHLRLVLRRIHDDEARHARLGWASLRWMIERYGEEMRRFALACIDRATAAAAGASEAVELDAPDHGVLGSDEVAEVRRIALVEVVGRLRDALAAGSRRPSPRPRAVVAGLSGA